MDENAAANLIIVIVIIFATIGVHATFFASPKSDNMTTTTTILPDIVDTTNYTKKDIKTCIGWEAEYEKTCSKRISDFYEETDIELCEWDSYRSSAIRNLDPRIKQAWKTPSMRRSDQPELEVTCYDYNNVVRSCDMLGIDDKKIKLNSAGWCAKIALMRHGTKCVQYENTTSVRQYNCIRWDEQ